MEDIINEIVFRVLETHSFEYKTIQTAKKTVSVDNYYCIFDALSLCIYEHNFNNEELALFNSLLIKEYDIRFDDREHKKERLERVSLLHYLDRPNCLFSDFTIEKRIRPDFVLTDGVVSIGIEVTSLTSGDNEIMHGVSKLYFNKGFSHEEIKGKVIKKYPKKHDLLEYYDVNGTTAIATHMHNVGDYIKQYAELINKKYEMYKSDVHDFDKFIILADAEISNIIDISSIVDIEDLIKELIIINPNIKDVNVAIMWTDNQDKRIVSEFVY